MAEDRSEGQDTVNTWSRGRNKSRGQVQSCFPEIPEVSRLCLRLYRLLLKHVPEVV